MQDEAQPLGAQAPPSPPKSRPSCLALGCLLGLGVVGLGLVMPRGLPARAQGQLTACKSNCKNIATALEMYASDNQGLYPRDLQQLCQGNYLKVIPTCPTARTMTYSDYRTSPGQGHFSFSCVGNNHAKAYAGFPGPCDNFPQYNDRGGLIDHP